MMVMPTEEPCDHEWSRDMVAKYVTKAPYWYDDDVIAVAVTCGLCGAEGEELWSNCEHIETITKVTT